MLFNDFIDIRGINISIPDSLRVDHQHRAFIAPIQAACPVHANFSSPIFFEGLDFFFGVGLNLDRPAVGATLGVKLALVDAKKDVFFKITHGLDFNLPPTPRAARPIQVSAKKGQALAHRVAKACRLDHLPLDQALKASWA